MEAPTPVPLPASLPSVVLSYLVPAPNPPLPPEILSLSLTQLHMYLPPSLDDPVAHFLPSSTVPADVKQQIGETVHEIGRMMGEGEHPSLEPTYAFPDPLTLHARVLLFATPDLQTPSLELLFAYEGPERAWRLDGLRRAANSPAGVRWSSLDDALRTGREAVEKLAQEHELEETQGEDDRTDDFWGGYDSPPPPPEEERALSRVDSSASVNDAYWGQYGQVDDHVGPPSSGVSPTIAQRGLPSSRSSASGRSSVRVGAGSGRRSTSKDGWQQEAWGTGGETPVGWTPVMTPEHFTSDPRHRSSTITQHSAVGAADRRASTLSQGSVASERYPFPTHALNDDPSTFDRKRWAAEMPVFPEPDFKGLTPASMTPSTPPEAPSRLPLGTTILAAAAAAPSSRPPPPTAFGQPPSDAAPIKLTLPDFAAPQRSASFASDHDASASSLLAAQSPLHATLAGVFALHLAANPGKTRQQAAADWLKVALDVVAAQSGAVVNLDGDESPGAAQTPVGAVGPFGL